MSNHSPLDLHGEQQRKENLRAVNGLAANEADKDFLWLVSDDRGRRMVRRIISSTGVFTPNLETNALGMARRDGAKETGFWLLEQIERLCPRAFHTIMMEPKQND